MILVFGDKGQLATSLRSSKLGREAIFLGSEKVNFLQTNEIHQALQTHRPKLIINTAAYTNVDRAESEKDLAQKINAVAVGFIAQWAADNDVSMIHFSTDYTYPGTGNRPWVENQSGNAVNWYGETKLLGERKIRDANAHAVIFKTSWIFSEFGNNFLKTMLMLGKTKKEIRVVDDQYGTPTYAIDLAQFTNAALPKVIAKEVSGTFNICNHGITNWYEFAGEIFKRTKSGSKLPLEFSNLVPISSADFKSAARRPMNSQLDTTRAKETFNFSMPSWQDAVNRCLSSIENEYEKN